jgi:hypothetical protein
MSSSAPSLPAGQAADANILHEILAIVQQNVLALFSVSSSTAHFHM